MHIQVLLCWQGKTAAPGAPSLPASPTESLSQAEESFAVSWAALYWLHWLLGSCPGAHAAFALTAWLLGISLP